MTTPATAPAGYLRYDGRVAVVTGAGGGLGRAYALLLGSRGAKVVVNDVGGSVAGAGSDTRAAAKVVAEIRDAGGEAVSDYNSVEDGEAIIRTAVQAFGTIHILICNAGILRDGTFGKVSDVAWESVYKVHLYGSFACARAAWNHMRENSYGRIVFVTSSSGLYGNIGQSNYAAAKMGILGLASTLAREGARKNIVVNTIAPIAASRMTENVMPPDLLEVLKPESVAPVVGYLAHDTCTSTSGVYELGGGWVSRLRWQRSRGAFLPAGKALSLESVRAAWADANRFDDFAAYPDSTQSSFEPIMENLRKDTNAVTALDDSTGASAARSLEASMNTHDSAASVSSSLLAALPGGKCGRSDALDVPATLGHQLRSM
jgi:NAD(P)-dependent dehydrogenase (short-subunit alcohol dehydrogenase family)